VRAFGRIRLVASIGQRPGHLAFNSKKAVEGCRMAFGLPAGRIAYGSPPSPPDFLLVTVLASISGAEASL
jgi:hypothetical protein